MVRRMQLLNSHADNKILNHTSKDVVSYLSYKLYKQIKLTNAHFEFIAILNTLDYCNTPKSVTSWCRKFCDQTNVVKRKQIKVRSHVWCHDHQTDDVFVFSNETTLSLVSIDFIYTEFTCFYWFFVCVALFKPSGFSLWPQEGRLNLILIWSRGLWLTLDCWLLCNWDVLAAKHRERKFGYVRFNSGNCRTA